MTINLRRESLKVVGNKTATIMLHKIYVRINCVRYGGEKVFRDVAYMTTKGENPCQGWCFNNPDQ